MKIKTSKRCGCRDEDGKQLGKNCPRLRSKGHGTWSYRFRVPPDLQHLVGGKAFATKSGFPTAKQAEDAADKLIARLRDDQEVTGITVETYLTEWLAGKRKLRPSTARSYSDHIRMYFIPKLGHLRLDKLRPKDLLTCYDEILAETADHARPVTPASIERFNATMRSALGAAVKQKRLGWNAAAHVELPEVEHREAEPWSAIELGTFLDAAAIDRLSALYEVMAFTGLRRGQAIGLHWSDIDLEAGILVARDNRVDVAGTVHVGPAKSRSSEGLRLDLDGGTVGALMAHRLAQDDERETWGDEYHDEDLVFCYEDGQALRPEYASRHMLALAKRAGRFGEVRTGARKGATVLDLRNGTRGEPRRRWTIYRNRDPIGHVEIVDLARTRHSGTARLVAPLAFAVKAGDELGENLLSLKRLHDLRHGAASLEIDAGADLSIVSKRRGHSSIRITSDAYVHMQRGGAGKQVADAAAKLVPRATRPRPEDVPAES